ncbi:hypothetical protein MRX96_009546 [Rhipicephalus microplus]
MRAISGASSARPVVSERANMATRERCGAPLRSPVFRGARAAAIVAARRWSLAVALRLAECAGNACYLAEVVVLLVRPDSGMYTVGLSPASSAFAIAVSELPAPTALTSAPDAWSVDPIVGSNCSMSKLTGNTCFVVVTRLFLS